MKHLILIAASLLSTSAFAYDQIYHPFQSARSVGMGGTKVTTGLYEDNFFGNPARVVDNPKWKVSLFDLTLETNSGAMSNISKIVTNTNDGGVLRRIAQTTGSNNHLRIQTAMPSVYIPAGEGKWGFGLGVLMNTQLDLGLRRSYLVDPQVVTDVGPAFNIGRKFMENNVLAVGATAHLTYRVSSKPDFDTTDLLSGTSLSPIQSGGEGAHFDVDLGTRYIFDHFRPMDLEFALGASINNVLGGKYSNLPIDAVETDLKPRTQPRSFGLGLSVKREHLGPAISNFIAAFEFNDIGNNSNGSMWRTVHIGAEGKILFFTARAGLNQGYITAGLGFDLRFVTLDLATYGEEMSLNVGGLQDRRYVMKLALQI